MAANEMTAPARKAPAMSRSATRISPFDLLQGEIDRVFDTFAHWRGIDAGFNPSMEVTETDNSIEISTELPGMNGKDVEIRFANDILTIRGEKKAEREEQKTAYRLVERSYGSFERSLALPPGINADSIKASMSMGVLKITLPKTPAAQSQKVKIDTPS